MANIATALHITVDSLLGNDEEEYPFSRVKNIIARNAGQLSSEEKRELINAILEG